MEDMEVMGVESGSHVSTRKSEVFIRKDIPDGILKQIRISLEHPMSKVYLCDSLDLTDKGYWEVRKGNLTKKVRASKLVRKRDHGYEIERLY